MIMAANRNTKESIKLASVLGESLSSRELGSKDPDVQEESAY